MSKTHKCAQLLYRLCTTDNNFKPTCRRTWCFFNLLGKIALCYCAFTRCIDPIHYVHLIVAPPNTRVTPVTPVGDMKVTFLVIHPWTESNLPSSTYPDQKRCRRRANEHGCRQRQCRLLDGVPDTCHSACVDFLIAKSQQKKWLGITLWRYLLLNIVIE